jgi:hypothetical protein
MTRALPYTEASIARLIKGIERAGRFVVGARPDGTLIIADKPIDPSSLAPLEAPTSPPPVRRLGEKLNGGEGDASRS